MISSYMEDKFGPPLTAQATNQRSNNPPFERVNHTPRQPVRMLERGKNHMFPERPPGFEVPTSNSQPNLGYGLNIPTGNATAQSMGNTGNPSVAFHPTSASFRAPPGTGIPLRSATMQEQASYGQ